MNAAASPRTWADLVSSDLWTWFHLEEASRTAGIDRTHIRIRNAGFTDRLVIHAYVSNLPDYRVMEAGLVVDGEWAMSPAGSPGVADLVASFVRFFAEADPATERLCEPTTWMRAPGFTGAGADRSSAATMDLAAAVREAVAVYAGLMDHVDVFAANARLRVGNQSVGGRRWFSVHWFAQTGVTIAVTQSLRDADYASAFVDRSDLPPYLDIDRDERAGAPDPEDGAFARHRGLRRGVVEWAGPVERPIARLVDARWQFPSAELARAYHHASLAAMADGAPALGGAKDVGVDCAVFGGPQAGWDVAAGLPAQLASYVFAFSAGPLVARVVAMEAQDLGLTAKQVHPIARNAAMRIERLLQ